MDEQTWKRPAKIFDHYYLREVLEKDFIAKTNKQTLGFAVLMYPSLETFNSINDDLNGRESNLKSIWLDLYSSPQSNARALLIVPVDQNNRLPPRWLGVEYIKRSLIHWLDKTTDEDDIGRFKELCKRVEVIFVPEQLKVGTKESSTNNKNEKEIAYAFGIYFLGLNPSDLYSSIARRNVRVNNLVNNLVNNVHMILGTSIGEPFSEINDNGHFEYNLLLSFDHSSSLQKVPENVKENSRCIIEEHLKLLVKAYRKRMILPLYPVSYTNEKTDLFCGDPDSIEPRSLDQFIAWAYLHLDGGPEGWKFVPNNDDSSKIDEIRKAFVKAGLISEENISFSQNIESPFGKSPKVSNENRAK